MNQEKSLIDSPISDRLKEAFIELYGTLPIEKISIKMITDRAGLYRGTFYLHFCDIYDLRDQIVDDYKELIILISKQSTVELLSHGNIQKTLPDFDFYQSHKKYLKVLLCDYSKSDLHIFLKDNLKASLIANVPSLRDSQDPLVPYILEYMASAEVSIITHWISSDLELPIETISQFMTEISSMGIVGYLKGM